MKNTMLWFNFIGIDNLDYLLEAIMYNKESRKLAYVFGYNKEPITKIIFGKVKR